MSYTNYFPFSPGVSLASAKASEHADGLITIEEHDHFIFSPLHPRWNGWPRFDSSEKSSRCLQRVFCSADPDTKLWEKALHLAAHALARDGAVVLVDALLPHACRDALEALCTMQAASRDVPSAAQNIENILPAGLFPCLGNPLLMALCDGVIGRQALTADERGLKKVVVAPGIFTDDKRIQSLPWELQALSYSTGSDNETSGLSISSQRSEDSPHFVRGDKLGPTPFTLSQHVEQNVEALVCLSDEPNNQLVVPVVLGSHKRRPLDNEVLTEWVGTRGEILVCLGGTSFAPPLPPRARVASPAFGYGSNSNVSPGFGPGTDFHAPFLGLSYHAAYLRQRQNLFLAVPPPLAIALPPHVSRFLGYFKPGPVLNKLYCGSGNSDILEAFKSYNGRAVDWAGQLSSVEGVAAVASSPLCGDIGVSRAPTPRDYPAFRSPHEHELPNRSRINDLVVLLPKQGSMAGEAPSGVSTCPRGLVSVDQKEVGDDDTALGFLLAALQRDGCVVLRSGISSEVCDEIEDQFRPYSEDVGGASVGSALARSKACWSMAAHSLVVAICEAVLGRQILRMDESALASVTPEHANSAIPRIPWQIQLALTIPKQAGGLSQQLHRDGDLSLLALADLANCDHAISVIWALDGDFTEARGATRVCPGSHNWNRDSSTWPADEMVDAPSAVMPRGSAIIYTGRTVHGAGHNQTDSPRVAFNVAYNSACLKQEENMYVATPPVIAAALPQQLKELIGYD